MRKGEETPQRLCVEYKGKELILAPGHSVWELNLKTGIITPYELIKKPIPVTKRIKHLVLGGIYGKLDKRPRYLAEEIEGKTLLLPAFDIDKARIQFKRIAKILKLNVRIVD